MAPAGPAAGGTTLAIHLAAASLHVSLGGLLCRFDAPVHERVGGRVRTRNVSLVTPASVAPCGACEAICSTGLCNGGGVGVGGVGGLAASGVGHQGSRFDPAAQGSQ